MEKDGLLPGSVAVSTPAPLDDDELLAEVTAGDEEEGDISVLRPARCSSSMAPLCWRRKVSSGSAFYDTSSLIASTHAIKAVYVGNTTDNTSASATLSEVINKSATTTKLTASVNPSEYLQAVTFTATVTSAGGVLTGTVTFERNGVSIGTGALTAGVAHLTTSTVMLVGSHTITAVCAATADYLASTSAALTETTKAAPTTTIVTSSLNLSTHGPNVTFTGKATPGTSGTPTGTVTFKDGSATLGTGTLSSGSATFATTALSVGTRSITVVYAGSADYAASTSPAFSHVVH